MSYTTFDKLLVSKLLVKYLMQDSKKVLLSFRHGVTLSKDQCHKTSKKKNHIKSILYALTMGNLMYAMLCTKLDICFVIGLVSRYQSNPSMEHWMAIKNILKYL